MKLKASLENVLQQTAGYYTPLMRDNSTGYLQCTLFLKIGSHYLPRRGIVQLSNSAALRYRNWSFTNKFNNLIY